MCPNTVQCKQNTTQGQSCGSCNYRDMRHRDMRHRDSKHLFTSWHLFIPSIISVQTLRPALGALAQITTVSVVHRVRRPVRFQCSSEEQAGLKNTGNHHEELFHLLFTYISLLYRYFICKKTHFKKVHSFRIHFFGNCSFQKNLPGTFLHPYVKICLIFSSLRRRPWHGRSPLGFVTCRITTRWILDSGGVGRINNCNVHGITVWSSF